MHEEFVNLDDFIEINEPFADLSAKGSLSADDLISGAPLSDLVATIGGDDEFSFFEEDFSDQGDNPSIAFNDMPSLDEPKRDNTPYFPDYEDVLASRGEALGDNADDEAYEAPYNASTSHDNTSEGSNAPLPLTNAARTIRDAIYDGHNVTSYNKIKTPPESLDPSYGLKNTVKEAQDQELLKLARNREVFSLDSTFDNQVVSPTVSEFVAEYYRLINSMILKVTLNQLVVSKTRKDSLWINGQLRETVNISGNKYFHYDSIYMHCTKNTIIQSLREKYEHKRLHFTQMDVYQVMGAGHGISSAQQATIFLEKMATASLSTCISSLSYRDSMMFIKNWFEGSFPNSEFRQSILNLIQDAVFESSKKQALAFESDREVFVVKNHHCLLFAKKLLNRHGNIQLPNHHLHLTALVVLLSGVALDKPNLANIAFYRLFDGLKGSDSLMDSFVKLSYESHRHCYPINELSKI